jgi:hypothetical protein
VRTQRLDQDDVLPMPRTFRDADDPDAGSDDREPMLPDGPADTTLRRIVGGFFACAIVLAGLIRLLHAA